MPDKIEQLRVISRGGLDTSENYLMFSEQEPGIASVLINYEPAFNGGYRRLSGFEYLDANYPAVGGASAEGKVLGIWSFYDATVGEDIYIAARKNTSGNTYSLWWLDTATGWTAFTTGTTQSSVGVDRVRAEIFNFGDAEHIIFVDGVNKALVYNGTTWYQLDSANAGGSAAPGGDQVLDAPSVVTVFKNHVFLSGDSNNPSIVCHSAPNDALTWTSAAGGGQVTTGIPVTQIKSFRNDLFVFGKSKIKKIAVSGTDFVLQDVTNTLGLVARDSVLEMSGNLVFWSSDGVRPIAGTERIDDIELSILSQNIQRLINLYQNSYNLDNLCAVAVKQKTQFRYFLPTDGETATESPGIIGGLRVKGQQGPTWEFGEIIGIQASCAFSGYRGTEEVVLHGDLSGNAYIQESGNDFNGENIVSVYTTPFFDFGNTEIRKTMRTMNLFTRVEGSVDINLAVRYDWRDTDAINPVNYLQDSDQSLPVYDGGFNYDGGTLYGGTIQPVLKKNIEGSGYSVQFSFVTNDTNPSHAIQGFVIEFSIKGRQ